MYKGRSRQGSKLRRRVLRAIYFLLPAHISCEDHCWLFVNRLLHLNSSLACACEGLYHSTMMYLLLFFLFIPFAVLGTPVSPVLPAVSPVPSATPTSPEGNSSISGYVNNSTNVNGTEETPVGEEYCPSPRGPHVIPIDIGFAPFTVS